MFKGAAVVAASVAVPMRTSMCKCSSYGLEACLGEDETHGRRRAHDPHGVNDVVLTVP